MLPFGSNSQFHVTVWEQWTCPDGRCHQFQGHLDYIPEVAEKVSDPNIYQKGSAWRPGCELSSSGLLQLDFLINPEQELLYIFSDSAQTVCSDLKCVTFLNGKSMIPQFLAG